MKLLTIAEVEAAKADKKARDTLVKKMFKLVWGQVHFMLRFHRNDEQFEAFQTGMLGVLVALDKFDPAKVCRAPESYLLESAKNEIRKFIINISKSGFKMRTMEISYKCRLNEAGCVEFLTKDGRWLTESNVESWNELVKDYDENPMYKTTSLSSFCTVDDKQCTLEEIIKGGFDIETIAEERAKAVEVSKFVDYVKKNYSKRDTDIALSYFGLRKGVSVSSMEAVGKRHGISKGAVSKIIINMINRYQKHIGVTA